MKNMKRIIWLFIPCLLLFFWAGWLFVGGKKGDKNWKKVRFDGLYVSPPDRQGDIHYLRVYSDRTVITVYAIGKPWQVARWFNKQQFEPKRGMLKGSVQVRGNHIWFSAQSYQGVVDYAGTIDDSSSLTLESYSHMNGYRRRTSYKFVQVP